jgi:hypothetical protein
MPKGLTVSNICYILFDSFLLSYLSFLLDYWSIPSRHYRSYFFSSPSFYLLFIFFFEDSTQDMLLLNTLCSPKRILLIVLLYLHVTPSK